MATYFQRVSQKFFNIARSAYLKNVQSQVNVGNVSYNFCHWEILLK